MSKHKYTKAELKDKLDVLSALRDETQNAFLMGVDCSSALQQVAKYLSIARDYEQQADELMQRIKVNVRDQDKHGRNLFRLTLAIQWIEKASRKSHLSVEQVDSILRRARKQSERNL